MNSTDNGHGARLQNIYFQMAESNLRQEQSAQRQEELLMTLTQGLPGLTQNHAPGQKSKIQAATPKRYDGKPEELCSFLLSL